MAISHLAGCQAQLKTLPWTRLLLTNLILTTHTQTQMHSLHCTLCVICDAILVLMGSSVSSNVRSVRAVKRAPGDECNWRDICTGRNYCKIKIHAMPSSHLFCLALCLLTFTSSATAGPETLCGAELVDALQFVCGPRGFYFSE
ncbi:hypothetical protein A6R68_24017 [Neotoma lepida]|uniref:Insulin-like domain-containing protein n=1 Tax=Neotoma lepida TaxID=56216 RepID=A0A1A6HU67_NEOLE|nr:hypothetical protein A6R68_24017 [Neotoma lepida]